MYYIEKLPNVITIGRVGENNFRTEQFDMTEWMKDMPDGVPSIVVIAPGKSDEDAYIANTSFSNNILTWVISSSDTPSEGTGTIQIWLEEEDEGVITRRGKSATVAIRIYETVGATRSTPAAQTPWLEQMTALRTQTVNAKNAAVEAQGKAEEAQEAAEVAAGIAIAQAGQLKFSINENGHLIMSYTDEVPIAEEDEENELEG